MASNHTVGILVRGCRCALSYCDLSLTFDLDSLRTFFVIIFETYSSYDNNIRIDYYLHQEGIIFMTVCLSVCLFVCCVFAGLHKYYFLDLLEKLQDGLSLTKIPFNFERDLDHHVDTKKK